MTSHRSRVDLLAIGAHPDDVEIACGGTILQTVRAGGSAAIVDLSRGEKATRGDAETRLAEAAQAAAALGVSGRENLGLTDGAICDSAAARLALAAAIRRHRPRFLLAPHPEDDHPDHAAAGRLAAAASFLAGVGGVAAAGDRHRAGALFFYMMHHRFRPSLIVDVSAVYDDKLAAIRRFASQLFQPDHPPPPREATNVGARDFLERLRARHRFFGEMIGVAYGEPLAAPQPPGVRDLRSLIAP